MPEEQPFSFAEPLDWRLVGTPEMVSAVLVGLGREMIHADRNLDARPLKSRLGGVRIRVSVGGNAVGLIELHELPGQRCRLRVPANGGLEENWLPADAEWLSAFLRQALKELQSLGFLSTSSRFESHSILETATRELEEAEESEAIAAVGNIMRIAMLELADELYADHMLPDAAETLKKDDAKRKLRLVINHYFAGRSENYRKGLVRSAEGAWMAVNALVHRRKRAKREEAEICLALVRAQFDVFSLIVPED